MKIGLGSLVFCLVLVISKGQVSTKLDLDEGSNEGTVSKGPTKSTLNSSSNSKISPKIEGVRVTVDTGDGKKTKEAESKESVEIIDNNNKNTKRVGIHTDITFEITDDKIDPNATSSEQAERDNDASVPIFKGRTTTRRPHSRQPYNPKIHIDYPDQPSYNHGRGRTRYNSHNTPVYTGPNDEGIYHPRNRWSNVIPIPQVWTTERSSFYIPSRSHQRQDINYRTYDPSRGPTYSFDASQQQFLDRHQSLGSGNGWQPCVCVYDTNSRNSNEWKGTSSIRSFRSASAQINSKVDGMRRENSRERLSKIKK